MYIGGLVVYTAYVQHLKFHLLSMLRYGKNLDVRVNFIIRQKFFFINIFLHTFYKTVQKLYEIANE